MSPAVARADEPSWRSVEDAELRRLESRGYAVIPGFLSDAQVRTLERDYREQAPKESQLATARAYARRTVSAAVQAALRPQIEQLAARVRAVTRVRADLLTDGTLFFDTRSNDPFQWHTDHIPRLIWRDVYNYLNFYVPIVKPDPDRSGLCMVRMDLLEARAPELHAKLVGKGAIAWSAHGGEMTARDDNEGVTLGSIDWDLSEVSESPRLRPGDLLLMRGDVPHRTQDVETERVAVSFRMIASGSVVDRSHYSGHIPEAKLELMLALAPTFLQILSLFHARSCERVTLGELHAHLRATAS